MSVLSASRNAGEIDGAGETATSPVVTMVGVAAPRGRRGVVTIVELDVDAVVGDTAVSARSSSRCAARTTTTAVVATAAIAANASGHSGALAGTSFGPASGASARC